MRKILTIIILLSVLISTRTYAVSFKAINIDIPTMSAMSTAYGVEVAQETRGTAALKNVLDHYTTAGLATTGIFTSKWWEMRALADPGLFGKDELLYYSRIKSLVVDQITPRILSVSAQMIKDPADFLWWGPFLYKITTDVEERCKQYELVVANGKQTFQDVQFLVINEALGKYVNLAKLGDVDWKTLLEKVTHFGDGLDGDDIKSDFKNLGATIAQIGKGVVKGDFSKLSKIGKIFHSSPSEIIDMYHDFKSVYDKYKDIRSVRDAVMAVLGTSDVEGLKNLFHIDDYNITNYLNNYVNNLQGQYYRQRWYIYTVDAGDEIIADWQPKEGTPTEKYWEDKNKLPSGWDDWDQHSVYNRKWYGNGNANAIDAYNAHSQLTGTLIDKLKKQALDNAGWSESKRKNYQTEHKGHTISFEYTSYHEDRIKFKGKYGGHNHWEGWCYRSYGVSVRDTWNVESEVYDEMFDSQTMDRQTFIDKMETKLKWYQRQEDDKADKAAGEGRKYNKIIWKIGHDEPAYYSEADETKLKGVYSVTYTARCYDGAKLAEGMFSWKENSKAQGKTLDEQSERFAMGQISNFEDESGEINSKKNDCQKNITNLQNKINALEQRRADLLNSRQQAVLAGDADKAARLKEEYDKLDEQEDDLNAELETEQAKMTELATAEKEYYNDIASLADEDPTRINSNMAEVQALYQLQWQDDGAWVDAGDRKIFTRHAYCPSMKSVVDYTAELSITRKPSYLAGIRIHRAILQVDYTLSANYGSENVIETLKLDPKKSEKENTKIVNDELRKLMDDYPKCTIDMKYNKSNDNDSTDTDDAYHLLWVSDRLEVARQIEADLVDINSQLIFIQMGLHSRNVLRDFLKSALPNFVSRKGRSTIAQFALGRWQQASVAAMKGSVSPKFDKTSITNNSTPLVPDKIK